MKREKNEKVFVWERGFVKSTSESRCKRRKSVILLVHFKDAVCPWIKEGFHSVQITYLPTSSLSTSFLVNLENTWGSKHCSQFINSEAMILWLFACWGCVRSGLQLEKATTRNFLFGSARAEFLVKSADLSLTQEGSLTDKKNAS